jgi:enoyl-CoA hydratase/carnithine racemase
MVGCDAAFDIIATGRHVKAIEALDMGLVDRILTTGAARDGNGGQQHFEEELEDFVLSNAVQQADLTSRTVSQRIVTGGPVSAAAIAKTQAHSFGGFVAPSMIHLAVDASTRMSFEKGLEYEFKLFESLMQGPQARAMQVSNECHYTNGEHDL